MSAAPAAEWLARLAGALSAAGERERADAPIRAARVPIYQARVEARLDLFTGGPRRPRRALSEVARELFAGDPDVEHLADLAVFVASRERAHARPSRFDLEADEADDDAQADEDDDDDDAQADEDDDEAEVAQAEAA